MASLMLPAAAQNAKVGSFHATPVRKQTVTIEVPNFADLTEAQAEEAATGIFTSIGQIESNLIQQLKNKKLSPDSKDAIIRVLGGLRSDRAVPILAENIDFRRPMKPGDELPPTKIERNWYPARDALKLIGEPATGWILHYLGSPAASKWTPQDHVSVDGFVEVLIESLGFECAVARLAILERNANDPMKKERYKQLSLLIQRRQTG